MIQYRIFFLLLMMAALLSCNESTVNPTFQGKTRMELLTANSWIFESATNFGPKAIIMKFNDDKKFEYYDDNGKKFLDNWEFAGNQTQIYSPEDPDQELADIIELTSEKLVLKISDGSKISTITYRPIYKNPVHQNSISISGTIDIKIDGFDLTKYVPVVVWSQDNPDGGFIYKAGQFESGNRFSCSLDAPPYDSLLYPEGNFKFGLARIYVVDKNFAGVGFYSENTLDEIIHGGIKGYGIGYYEAPQSDTTEFKSLFQMNKGYNLLKIYPEIPDLASFIPVEPTELTLVISDNPYDFK